MKGDQTLGWRLVEWLGKHILPWFVAVVMLIIFAIITSVLFVIINSSIALADTECWQQLDDVIKQRNEAVQAVTAESEKRVMCQIQLEDLKVNYIAGITLCDFVITEDEKTIRKLRRRVRRLRKKNA